MTDLRAALEQQMAKNGLRMHKQLSSGGFLGYPTYDERTVYSTDTLFKLNNEGFIVGEDMGAFTFNAMMQYVPPKPVRRKRK